MSDRLEFDESPALPESGSPGPKLFLNFRSAPLREVLGYFSDAADFSIEVESNVKIDCPIELCNDEPVGKDEAVMLLKEALLEHGYMAIYRNGLLTIIRKQDAKKYCIPLPTVVYSTAV